MSTRSTLATLVACAGLTQLPAAAALLDFGGAAASPTICSATSDGLGAATACANNLYLLQSYGDIAGVVDMTYSAPRQPGLSLRWWADNYNNLHGVAWADGSDPSSRGRIEIKAANPLAIVTLFSLDLGAYSNTTLGTTLLITTIGGGTTLYSYTGLVGNASTNTATSFSLGASGIGGFSGVSAVGGLWIDWYDSAYNVGIDNISYAVGAPVPEPGTAAVLLAGLAAVSLLVRRRQG